MMPGDSESALRGHELRNAELLEQLKSRGVDLKCPRSIEQHFWSKSQRDAALLANELYRRGFLLLVLAPAASGGGTDYTWNVEAGVKDSIERAASRDVAREFVALAASFDSRYDGWGTAV